MYIIIPTLLSWNWSFGILNRMSRFFLWLVECWTLISIQIFLAPNPAFLIIKLTRLLGFFLCHSSAWNIFLFSLNRSLNCKYQKLHFDLSRNGVDYKDLEEFTKLPGEPNVGHEADSDAWSQHQMGCWQCYWVLAIA